MSTRPKNFSGTVLAAAAAVFAATMATGCTSLEHGQPRAAQSATNADSQQEPQQGPQLPPRPRELPLRGIDPCTLLTDAQLDQLQVTSEPRPAPASNGGSECSLDADLAEPYYSYGIETITNVDVTAWLSGNKHKTSMRAEPTTVADFPALTTFRAESTPTDCDTLVGVAHGQTLRVQMYLVSADAFSTRQLCDMSKQAATLAVQSLQAGE